MKVQKRYWVIGAIVVLVYGLALINMFVIAANYREKTENDQEETR